MKKKVKYNFKWIFLWFYFYKIIYNASKIIKIWNFRSAVEKANPRSDARVLDVRAGGLAFTSTTIFSIISQLKNNLNELYSLFLIEFKIKILYDIILKILKK